MTRILTINEFRNFLIIEGKKTDEEKLAILKKKIADWDEEHESALAKKRNGSSLKKKERLRKRIASLQKKIKKETAAMNEGWDKKLIPNFPFRPKTNENLGSSEESELDPFDYDYIEDIQYDDNLMNAFKNNAFKIWYQQFYTLLQKSKNIASKSVDITKLKPADFVESFADGLTPADVVEWCENEWD